MRILGISSEMAARALNAPDGVQRLPPSTISFYFREFDGRTIRAMTTLDDCVATISWRPIEQT
jgi:hypothetical protein